MLPDFDPARPEQYDWSAVGPPELAEVGMDVARQCRIVLVLGTDENGELSTRNEAYLAAFRASLTILAHHARPRSDTP